MMAQAEVSPIAPTFFISLLVVGLFLLLNIFITVLLEAFADDDEEEEADDAAAMKAEAKAEAKARARAKAKATGCCGDRALCIFAPTSPTRRLCHRIIGSKHFDRFIIVIIVVSSICLVLDSPRVDPASQMGSWLLLANRVFTVIFTCEFVLKAVALGFACHEGAYIRDPWNVLPRAQECPRAQPPTRPQARAHPLAQGPPPVPERRAL